VVARGDSDIGHVNAGDFIAAGVDLGHQVAAARAYFRRDVIGNAFAVSAGPRIEPKRYKNDSGFYAHKEHKFVEQA